MVDESMTTLEERGNVCISTVFNRELVAYDLGGYRVGRAARQVLPKTASQTRGFVIKSIEDIYIREGFSAAPQAVGVGV